MLVLLSNTPNKNDCFCKFIVVLILSHQCLKSYKIFCVCSQSLGKCSTVSGSLVQNEHVGLFINFILCRYLLVASIL